jgi:hypothetical protein
MIWSRCALVNGSGKTRSPPWGSRATSDAMASISLSSRTGHSIALIQIKNEASFAPLCELQCGNLRAQPAIPLNPPQQGSALILTNSRNHRTCRFATDLPDHFHLRSCSIAFLILVKRRFQDFLFG